MTLLCIAIDGPAAAGKGTIAKEMAAHLGFAYLDTGLLYRAVGRKVLAGENPLDAAKNLCPADLNHPDLRQNNVAAAASEIAADPNLRQQLIAYQREFANRPEGAVLDGRDIGTVICPDAPVKIFVTAKDSVRAARRFAELKSSGADVSEAEVLAELRARDQRDQNRQTAPLRPAKDATVIDTSALSIDEALREALRIASAAGIG